MTMIMIINYIYIAHFHDRSCSMRFTSQNISLNSIQRIK